MLSLLTDAHISPIVAEQIKAKRPEIVIYGLPEWRDGAFLEEEDDVILAAALQESLTLVTYDQRTIPPILTQWAMEGRDHAGVIFVDGNSIAQADVGGKVRALLKIWEQAHALDWTNAITYLKPNS